MEELLVSQVRTALELVLAAAEGEGLAQRVLKSGDSKVQIRRLLQRLSGEESTPVPNLPQAEWVSAEHATHLIVGHGGDEARSTLSSIRKWLRGSQRLTICDPYFLQPPQSNFFRSEEDYVDAIVRLLPPSAEQIDIFCNGFKHSIRRKFVRAAKEGRAQLRIFVSSKIHDRFVLRDDEVKLVGTSFGGFGNKIFALLDLSKEDSEIVRRELTAIRLLASRRRFNQQSSSDGSVFT